MKKRIAVITDVHGNLEGLMAVLNDIKNNNIDDIYCLGDTVNLGPNSKECIDKLMELNIKMTVGNHELYLIQGTDIDPSIVGEEKEHYEWAKNLLGNRELDFIKKCPLYYEINIEYGNMSKTIMLCHYLIKDVNAVQPFEENHLKNDINLWIKYNNPNVTYIIGHLHKSFDADQVDGIIDGYITSTGELPNIEIIDSAGCSYDKYVSYMIIEIDRSIKYKMIKVKFDREKFVDKLNKIDFPDKKNIMKYFYGIENR